MSSRRDRARAANPDLTVLGFPGPDELRRRLPRLLVGLLALGIGIAMMVEARLGVSPYDVLHQGLADLTGLSFGTVVILLGVIVLFAVDPARSALRHRHGHQHPDRRSDRRRVPRVVAEPGDARPALGVPARRDPRSSRSASGSTSAPGSVPVRATG